MGRSQCPEKPQIVFAVRNVVKRFLPGLSSAPAAAPLLDRVLLILGIRVLKDMCIPFYVLNEVQFEDLKRNFHELESKFFSAVDNAIDSAGSVLLNPGGNGSREDGGTYLVCDRCNAHYRVRPLDDLSDFSGTCKCGGRLRFIEKFRR